MLKFKQWLAEQNKASTNLQSTKQPAPQQTIIKEQAAKQSSKSLAAIIKEQTAPVSQQPAPQQPVRHTLKQLRESIAARTK